LAPALAVALSALASGCGDDSATDGGADASVDGPLDATPGIPDGAILCEVDAACDDGVPCTNDICDARGFCRNVPDSAMCQDELFCNGMEICDRLRGCMMGTPETCSDGNVCTLDRCVEETRSCMRMPRDFDEDGEVDWHCEGGTDCDDRDPARGSLASEVCSDLEDNDCDETIDEATCGRPRYDTCDDPLDISGGGRFFVSNLGAMPDYGTACGGTGRRDVVATFTTTEPHELRVTAEGTGITAVALRTTCDDFASELDCGSGFPGTIRSRALPPGTYFLIVSDTGLGDIEIDLQLSDPLPAPTNETCAMPIDVSAGGTFTGSFVDVADDFMTTCSYARQADLVYSFTTTEAQDVRISLVSDTGDTMAFEVRSTCTDAGTTVRCSSGAPAGSTLHTVPAGTYFIIAEGPSFREVDFTLDVQFLPPTPVPPGDTCLDPVVLMPGVRTFGTLADKEDDHATSCGFSYRDMVYRFSIAARSDVAVTIDAGGTYMAHSIRTACGDGATQLRCTTGAPSRSRLRDLAAGTYYVLVESFRATGFNITLDVTAPTTSTPVTGNDNCFSAHVVPETGGLFTGSTVGLANDYQTGLGGCGSEARGPDAAFSLELTTRRRIIASTEGSDFDTVLHVHRTGCATGAHLYCDDDSGDGVTSLVDQPLDPGSYYFIVDGRGSASGNYYFEVQVRDP
jgi:hypothetical protein